MRVEDFMSTELITISPKTTIAEAVALCEKKKIHQLLVVEKDELIGLITDSDLRNILPSILQASNTGEALLKKQVANIMTIDVITTHPLDFIDEAAFTMYASHISCLPVMAQGKLVGIITETDILHALVEIMGVHKPSTLIKIEVDDQTGKLAEVIQLIKECQVNINNVLTYPSKNKGKKYLSFRLRTMDPRAVIKHLEAHQQHIVWPKHGEWE